MPAYDYPASGAKQNQMMTLATSSGPIERFNFFIGAIQEIVFIHY